MWAFSFYGLIGIVRQSQSLCQKDAVKMVYLPLVIYVPRQIERATCNTATKPST